MTSLRRPPRSTAARAAAITALCLSACKPSVIVPPPLDPMRAGETGRLIVGPKPVLSLGTLAPGQSASGRMSLRNTSASAVTVARIDTSCPCVRVAPLTTRIDSGTEATLTVAFDPTEEPDFRGGLSVELTGFDVGGFILFKARVDLDIRTAPATPNDGPVAR
jgi:hypothetical protein